MSKFESVFRTIVIVIIVSCGWSCRTITTEPPEPVESDTTISAIEILSFDFTISNDSGWFIANPTIDSVSIWVNGVHWRTMRSQERDTSELEIEIRDSLYKTKEPFVYLALFDVGETGEYFTAGEYADHLNDNLRLIPGSYSLEIRNIQFRNVDSTLLTYPISLFTDFNVADGARSVHVGSYDIKI